MTAPGPPIGMLAELTHRCPLQCPYCSNPAELLKANRELDTDAWISVFRQAADLGILQVHLSGGEPTLRRDLETLVGALSERGVYTNLITAGVNLEPSRLAAFKDAGLDHVQLSFQGARAATTEKIGNYRGGHEKKRQTAEAVRALGLPLTINAPIHRHNIAEVPDFIELALELDAERLEIANVQYYGWALLNRSNLMPTRDTVMRQAEIVEEARERLRGVLAIDFVTPDYYAAFPKPCMGGWARDAFMIAPDGAVMPCHAAHTIPSLSFDRVPETPLAEIWENSPAFNAFRGTDWMQTPCRTCDRREIDFGGCRCQAMAIAGDAAATDPACSLSPMNARILQLAAEASGEDAGGDFIYRRIGATVAAAE
jgi:PqqA peptide cyclase